jgi:hypothetical protein
VGQFEISEAGREEKVRFWPGYRKKRTLPASQNLP